MGERKVSGRKKRVLRMPTQPAAVGEEVRFHLEKKVERLVREGLSEEQAWVEARRRFGDVEKVQARMTREGVLGMWWGTTWDRIRQDVHYAARQALRAPAFSAITVLTLALGISSTTAIFSVVDGILFRPLPFPEPDELTVVWADWSRRGGPADEWMNFADFFDIKERARSFSAISAWDGGGMTLTGRGEPEQIVGGMVSHDMISDVLGVSPALGRGFTPEDDQPGAAGTVLLTDAFWRRAFGGTRDVIGSTVILGDESYTTIGVLPPDFEPPFMTNADMWLALRQDQADNFCGRGSACLHVVGRRATDSSLSDARTELSGIAVQLGEEYPRDNANTGFTLRPLREDMVADTRTGLLVLMAAVGFVLLIACVNVANLLMARATTRRSELAVRSALGAARSRITSQLLTESALLAVIGGGLGLGLAYLATDLLVSYAPAGTPRIEGVGVDTRVLMFASAVTVLAGFLFGVVPALRGAVANLTYALKAGGRGNSGSRKGVRSRAALVSSQVALATVLLVGATLLLRSFQNLRSHDLGFSPAGVLTLQVGLPSTRYPDADARRGFLAEFEQRLGAVAGVESVGSISWLPLTGFGSDTGFQIEGRPPIPAGQNQAVWFRRITPGYPETMGMRLVSGRWITEVDNQDAPLVVVINDGMVRRHFTDEDPIGKRLNLGSSEDPRWREIVGIAAEARYPGIRGDSRDALYLPFAQAPTSNVVVTLSSSRDLGALGGDVQRLLAEMDPSLAAGRVRTMDAVVSASLGSEGFVTLLASLFAVVALLLAVVGLYGVVSYGVSHRLREMGVRVALGAGGSDIRGLVLKQSLTVVAVGLLLGTLAATGVTRLMENLLFGVSPTDPWTFAVVSLTLATVATAAAAIPARRAAAVDPITVLRAD